MKRLQSQYVRLAAYAMLAIGWGILAVISVIE